MREIKFRAWIKKEHKMIYGKQATAIDCFTSGFAYRYNEVELLQYTGLKDAAGREIYEGDLYSYDVSFGFDIRERNSIKKFIEAVEFRGGAFYCGDELLVDCITHDDSFAYVGDIYENPELLEKE